MVTGNVRVIGAVSSRTGAASRCCDFYWWRCRTTLAAKAATSAIPIVFVAGDDPTRAGLVKNINRPESNVTGATLYAFDLELKKLELLGETVPQVATIAILRNPKAPEAELQAASVMAVSGVLGRQIEILSASTESEIDAAFETLPGSHAGAVLWSMTSSLAFGANR